MHIKFIKDHKEAIFKTVGLTVAIILAVMLVIDYLPQIKLMFNPATRGLAIQSIRSHGIGAALMLVVMLVILTLIPGTPVSIVGVLSGICFGRWFGTLINFLGLSTGNMGTVFLVSKLRGMTKKYHKNRLAKVFAHIDHSLIALFIAYSLPFIPKYLISYLASKDPRFTRKQTLMAAVAGSIPVSFVYSFGGDMILQGNFKRLIFLVCSILILFAALYLFFRFLLRKHA